MSSSACAKSTSPPHTASTCTTNTLRGIAAAATTPYLHTSFSGTNTSKTYFGRKPTKRLSSNESTKYSARCGGGDTASRATSAATKAALNWTASSTSEKRTRCNEDNSTSLSREPARQMTQNSYSLVCVSESTNGVVLRACATSVPIPNIVCVAALSTLQRVFEDPSPPRPVITPLTKVLRFR